MLFLNPRRSPTILQPAPVPVAAAAARSRRQGSKASKALALLPLLVAAVCGCAALTNPAALGIPVRRLDPKFLAKPREDEVALPLNLLQRKQEGSEKILPGAILGVFVDNVLGDKNSPPPIQLPNEGSRLPPAIGFPIVVREDGTISLPFTDPIHVAGLTSSEAEAKVKKTLIDRGIINKDADQTRVIVTLQRQNTNHILVVRQDSGGVTFDTGSGLSGTKRGSGFLLDLPESESDVATALTRTGGLPGLDAFNEVYVLRPIAAASDKFPTVMPDLKAIARDPTGQAAREFGYSLSRIPLRMKPGTPLPFTRADVVLKTGDIVYIEARDIETFYVGGLIPSRQLVLPRDVDLDVLEALTLANAPFFNGSFGGNNLQGNFIQGGLGNPNPSDLAVIRRIRGVGEVVIRVDLNTAVRDPRERLIVMPGDILILQETLGEAFVRYVTQTFRIAGFGQILNTPSANISGSGQFP